MSAKRKKKKKSFAFIANISPGKVLWILAVSCILLYANTLRHQFVLDDAIVITENTFVKRGVKGIPDILNHDTFYGFFQEAGKDQLVEGGRYRPFSLVVFAAIYELVGEHPFVYHAMNILLYILCCVSVYFLVLNLLKLHLDTASLKLMAFVSSLLFAVHPIHTEVVANVKGADELLAFLFAVGAMYLVFKDEKKSIPRMLLSGLLFFLAMMSKEIAATFLGIILAAIWILRRKMVRSDLIKMLPLLGTFFLYILIRLNVLNTGIDGGSAPLELMNNPFLKLESGRYIEMSTLEKWPMIIRGIGMYIKLVFIPFPLTHDYYPRHPGIVGWLDWQVITTLIVLVLSVFVIFRYWKIAPIPVFGIIVFFLGLSLTANVLFPIGTNLSERFLFLPSLGWSIGMAWCILKAVDSGWKTPAIWATGVLMILFAILTVWRNPVWKDNYTLFTTDANTSANSAKVQNAAGGETIAYALTFSDTAAQNGLLRKAIQHLESAIQIHPRYKNAFLLLGNANYYLGQYERAIEYYNDALQLDGNYQEALQNRAYAYRDFGRYLGERRQDIAAALTFLQNAAQILHDDYETNRLLGVAYGNSGQPANAIIYFEKALQKEPDNAWINYNLGQAYQALGDSVNANRYISKSKALNPEIDR